jgi:hypothetical protein
MKDIKNNDTIQKQIKECVYLIILDCKDGLWDSLDVRRAHLEGRRLDKKPKKFNGPYLIKIGRNTKSQTLFDRMKSYRSLTTLPDSMKPIFDEKLLEHYCYDFTGKGTDYVKNLEQGLKNWINTKYKSKRYTTSEYYQLESLEDVLAFQKYFQIFFKQLK